MEYIHVNSMKRQSTYSYKYDYIQVSGIRVSPDLQRWRCQSHCHWSYLHLLKTNLLTWIK